MKESMPHHAENHGLAPGPGKASKLWTFILFLESEGGQVWSETNAGRHFCTMKT
jgi:hypothetical protein